MAVAEKLTLEINLGDGVQTGQQVYEALRDVQAQLVGEVGRSLFVPLEPGDEGPVRDESKNTIGRWAVE